VKSILKQIKALKDPEAFKLLGDETRRKIIYLLRAKEMTVSQIAEALNLTPQAVYHHIKKLMDGEMVEVTREERVDHIIESYYRATAESFQMVMGRTPSGREVAKEQMANILKALKKLGFKIEFNEKTTAQLTNVQVELESCCQGEKFEDAIDKLEDVDFVAKVYVEEFAHYLAMTDEEFAKQQELEKKFRDLLRSLVKK
jgi:DNA-binding transcriptional ArsR family regulator